MKTLLPILLAVGLVFAQDGGDAKGKGKGNGGKKQASQAHVLTNAEFDALLAKPDQILLIDVRRPDEIKDNGGFPVYLNIQANELGKRLDWIPKERTIITVSNHAARGGAAADTLTKAGFKVAGTIGAQTYEQDGGKLTRILAPPQTAAKQ